MGHDRSATPTGRAHSDGESQPPPDEHSGEDITLDDLVRAAAQVSTEGPDRRRGGSLLGAAAGDMIGGELRLLRPLGEGGMGSVWVAEHQGLDQQVAVKLISARMPPGDVLVKARFEREARTLAQLDHPNIVRLLGHGGAEDGPQYIVMELLEGESLNDRLLRAGTLSLRQCASLVDQVAEALHAAHAHSIVHRDIKPSNLLLVGAGDELDVRVLDLGAAKQTALPVSAITATGAMVGTPAYMSPEQLRTPKRVDQRTDLWSLGVLAYHAVTGRLPFDAVALGELLIAIVTAPFAPPTTVLPHLPRGFDEWCAKALRRDLPGRFQSARAMAEGLQEVVVALDDAAARRGGFPVLLGKDDDSTREDATLPRPPPPPESPRGKLTAGVAGRGGEALPSSAHRLAPEGPIDEADRDGHPPVAETAARLAARDLLPYPEALVADLGRPVTEPTPGDGAELSAGAPTAEEAEEADHEEEEDTSDSDGSPPPSPAESRRPPSRAAPSTLDPATALQAVHRARRWLLVATVVCVLALAGAAVRLSRTGHDGPAVAVPPPAASSSSPVRLPLPVSAPAQAPAPARDGMVLVPAGEFLMGCAGVGPCDDDEQPAHPVFVSGFFIERTEVPVVDYQQCVLAGGCDADGLAGDEACNWDHPGRQHHPINCVTWSQAAAYCAWRGKRLPTEAQWEKAARGTDGRTYPWGDEPPNCRRAVMLDGRSGCGSSSTWPVASASGVMARARGPFGTVDLAGNVWEWVRDRYDEHAYSTAARRDPTGPPSGQHRVIRGGGWLYGNAATLRASNRHRRRPDRPHPSIGFRCVQPN